MLLVRCFDLVSSHATQADCTRSEHLFSKFRIIKTNTLQLTWLPATKPYLQFRYRGLLQCSTILFENSVHISQKPQSIYTNMLTVYWEIIPVHMENHMFSRRFLRSTHTKKKEYLMSRPRPSFRLIWLSMTKPFNQRCWIKPVKTQQPAQFTDQLHVPTIHDHYRAGQKKEDSCTGTVISVPYIRSQSKKKPNIWNSASVSRRRMLATVVLCSGDFKIYFHTSHIMPLQLVIELRGLEWTCV